MKTRVLRLIPFLPFALAPLACGGSGGTAATGSGGSTGTASTGSDTTSSTGAGGASASTSSASGTTGSSGTGGSGACSGFIDVTETGGVPQHFASICAGSWGSSETMTAVGFHFAGGAAPGADEIDINGCATAAAGSAGLHLRTPKVSAPGTFLDGDADYVDAAGVPLSSAADPYKIVITKLDQPGGVIEGTFDLTVTGPTDGKKALTGTFHVCRVANEDAP